MSPVRVRQEAPSEQCSLWTLLLLFYPASCVLPQCDIPVPSKARPGAAKETHINDFLKFDHLKILSYCGILPMSFWDLCTLFQKSAQESKGRRSLLLITADRCYALVLCRPEHRHRSLAVKTARLIFSWSDPQFSLSGPGRRSCCV